VAAVSAPPTAPLIPSQAMLDQYSGENRGLQNLDSALRDAVQMVQVSDQRITYLRKMHALLLLRKCVPCRPVLAASS